MKSILVSLSIICAVTWTVDAGTCNECSKVNSDTCEGKSCDCPNATQCMVVSELYQVRNKSYHSIRKACNPGFPCGGLYISNFNDAFVRIDIHCCTGENCNTDNYKMPPEDIERKGKICPACFGDGLTECISSNTERCIHPDDLCGDYVGKIKDPGNNIKEFNFKGCVSALGCIYKLKALIGVEEIENIRFTCVPGK
ncbi:phospholipase A2 inhibitor gamma subunit B-like [Mixophyes fleayi]|uniref:phospholipase A2 inhibitor gamma subunit B-like n=1 Tax=Mixophyes fleayi TaxID=3061075 RepID=UPI003F4E1E58